MNTVNRFLYLFNTYRNVLQKTAWSRIEFSGFDASGETQDSVEFIIFFSTYN